MSELYIFDLNDELLTVISEQTGLLEARFKEELNQGSSFSFTVEADIDRIKYVVEENQVVFKDREGDLRLFTIKEIDDFDSTDGPITTAICEPAFMELKEHIVVDHKIINKEAQIALNTALAGTRWTGHVEVSLGLETEEFSYISSVDAIWKILNTWGGDFKDIVEFSGNQIIARKILIKQRLGADRGLRFEIDHNIKEIGRTVLSYPITALYGRGSSLREDQEGEHVGDETRLLDFANVEWSTANGDPVDKPLGKKWVGDPLALQKYKRLYNGELLHRESIYENSDIEDPEELLHATWEQLKRMQYPEVNYRLSVDLLDKPAELGDTARAIDREFAQPIEIQTRIIAIEYDLLDIEGTTIVEMGQNLSVHENNLSQEIDDLNKKINENRSTWEKVSNNSFFNIKPGIPQNVTAVGGFQAIQLYWDYDSDVYISHYEVYGSQVLDFVPDKQHLLWRGRVSAFAHDTATDQVWYYRVRAVNQKGTLGDFSPQVSASTVRIISDDILFGNITKDHIADLAIDASKLADMSVTGQKLADGSVIANKILDSAITNAKLAENAVASINIQNNAINNSKLDDLAVTAAKLANSSVTTEKIEIGAVNNSKLADLVVDANKLANSSVTSTKIANLAVGTAAIANSAITNAKIADLSVDTAKINNGSITSSKIANLAVGTAAIQDLAVTNAKIHSLHADKITAGVIAAERIAIGPLTKFSDEFGNISKNYSQSLTLDAGQGGKWFRIATLTSGRAHGKFILRDITSSQHSVAVFEAGINYSQNPYINLSSFGLYAQKSFTQVRIVYGSTYDPAYVEVYINNNARVQSLQYWLTDNVQVPGWVGSNWTIETVPAGYSTFTRNLDMKEATQGMIDLWRYRDTVYIDGGNIYANTVTANEIATGTITAASGIIANAAIGTAQIADVAITSAKIQNLAVGTAAIANGAISRAKLGTAVVGTLQVEDGAIARAKIANLAVDDSKIANLSVTKLLAGTIDANLIKVRGGNATEYSLLDGSLIESRGRFTRTFRGSTTTHDVKLKMEKGYFRARNDTLNRSLYFSDFGLSTFIDGSGEIAESRTSGTIEFFSRRFADHNGLTFYSSGVLGFDSDSFKVFSKYSAEIESEEGRVYLRPTVSKRAYDQTFAFMSATVNGDGYMSYGDSSLDRYSTGLRMAHSGTAKVSVVDSDFTTGGSTTIEAGRGEFNVVRRRSGNSYIDIQHANIMRVGSDSAGDRIEMMGAYNRTYSGAPNMFLTEFGTVGRSTSAKKYKEDIQVVDASLAESILKLQPKSWYDKSEIIENGGSTIGLKRHFGFVAEDVAVAGLSDYVIYHKGEIEGLEYERLWTQLIPVVNQIKVDLCTLQEEIQLLKIENQYMKQRMKYFEEKLEVV